ncbi:unknown [Coprobacillus sp. CAG:826]|nr:unknown [Coprobacillus sp. CAG:826]
MLFLKILMVISVIACFMEQVFLVLMGIKIHDSTKKK